jgi:hypothetical protein
MAGLKKEAGHLDLRTKHPTNHRSEAKARTGAGHVVPVHADQAASIIASDLFTVEKVRLKTLHVLFFFIDLHRERS